MRAKMAFSCRAIVGVHVNRIVGTGLHAGLTTNAAIGIEIDNSIFTLVHRRHRTDGDAGRLLAMVAARHLKHASRIRKDSLLNVLNPGSIDAYRHLVLSLASDGAGVASDALAVIDYKAVFHE
jgi:hypothetical protein